MWVGCTCTLKPEHLYGIDSVLDCTVLLSVVGASDDSCFSYLDESRVQLSAVCPPLGDGAYPPVQLYGATAVPWYVHGRVQLQATIVHTSVYAVTDHSCTVQLYTQAQ